MLEALADINAVSMERTELDPVSLILVRLAALIAVDAPAWSYLAHASWTQPACGLRTCCS